MLFSLSLSVSLCCYLTNREREKERRARFSVEAIIFSAKRTKQKRRSHLVVYNKTKISLACSVLKVRIAFVSNWTRWHWSKRRWRKRRRDELLFHSFGSPIYLFVYCLPSRRSASNKLLKGRSDQGGRQDESNDPYITGSRAPRGRESALCVALSMTFACLLKKPKYVQYGYDWQQHKECVGGWVVERKLLSFFFPCRKAVFRHASLSHQSSTWNVMGYDVFKKEKLNKEYDDILTLLLFSPNCEWMNSSVRVFVASVAGQDGANYCITPSS